MRAAGLALGAVRLIVAAAAIAAAAYLLSWQILFDGLRGSDSLFQLHLAQWVDSSFPALYWWYPWDDHGIAYREGYPLAAHWVTAAMSRAAGLALPQGMQVVQFAISPLDALGIYVYCAWRLRRPLAGFVGAIGYLLSPISWTFIVDWGFFSNQAGTALFMPMLIALDVFFEEWQAGRRGPRFRVAAVATMAAISAMGFVAPFLLGAAVAAVFLYAAAITSRGFGSRARWLFVTAPLLTLGAFVLTAFWSLPQQAYLAFIGAHVPARQFAPGLFPVWGLDQLFALHPLRLDQITDNVAIVPAVSIPAAVGAVAVFWNPRARALVLLVAYGLLTMTTTVLDELAWNVPVLGFLVHARAGVNLVQFLVPVLCGLGLSEVPMAAAVAVAKGVRFGTRTRAAAAAALVVLVTAADLVIAGASAHRIAGNPSELAYGDFHPTSLSAPWPPSVGCIQDNCRLETAATIYGSLFPAPPQRALVDAHVPLLLMDFRGLTGGGQAYTYNFQLPASSELDNWMLDSMLNHRGTTVKSELASTAGIDAVVLGPTQAAQAADYAALGWTQTSSSPLTFVNPSPAGLAAEWPAGEAILVVGSDQTGHSHPYNDLFDRATSGMIPYSSGWLVRGNSAYIDDYSAEQLAAFPALMLVGYRYHDRSRAWDLLDGYVRAGGSLYVETGWQYVDPDWDLGANAPAPLPVGELRWGQLDPSAPVLVEGTQSTSWGSLAYGSGGWGASSAATDQLRNGAEALVTVGGRVTAARWQLGRGRVLWSGMNLIAHAAGVGSEAEDRFVAAQFAWLTGGTAPQQQADVTWVSDDQASVQLTASDRPTWVLFKESYAPGWSARLNTPAGSSDLPLIDGELDFMLVRLDSVADGSSLIFTYGPTSTVYAAWALTTLGLAALLLWIARPRLYRLALVPFRRLRFGWSDDEE